MSQGLRVRHKVSIKLEEKKKQGYDGRPNRSSCTKTRAVSLGSQRTLQVHFCFCGLGPTFSHIRLYLLSGSEDVS